MAIPTATTTAQPLFRRVTTEDIDEALVAGDVVTNERCKDIHLVIKFDMAECFEEALKTYVLTHPNIGPHIVRGPYDRNTRNSVTADTDPADVQWVIFSISCSYPEIEKILNDISPDNVRIISYMARRLEQLSPHKLDSHWSNTEEGARALFWDDIVATNSGLRREYFRRLLDMRPALMALVQKGHTQYEPALNDVRRATDKLIDTARTAISKLHAQGKIPSYNFLVSDDVAPLGWLVGWAIRNINVPTLQLAIHYYGGQLYNATNYLGMYDDMLLRPDFVLTKDVETYVRVGELLESQVPASDTLRIKLQQEGHELWRDGLRMAAERQLT